MHLILATRNRHKVQEIQAILGPEIRCEPMTRFGNPPSLVEDAPTFEGNAFRKATQVLAWLQTDAPSQLLPSPADWNVLADDSGLEVDALQGDPGVRSARFAAEDVGADGNASDNANTRKLLHLLAQIPDGRRTARFRCAMVLLAPTGAPQVFRGACEGRIAREPAGSGGFGYDPVFVPDGYACSFAELGEDVKNRLSHRARALAALKQWLTQV